MLDESNLTNMKKIVSWGKGFSQMKRLRYLFNVYKRFSIFP